MTAEKVERTIWVAMAATRDHNFTRPPRERESQEKEQAFVGTMKAKCTTFTKAKVVNKVTH